MNFVPCRAIRNEFEKDEFENDNQHRDPKLTAYSPYIKGTKPPLVKPPLTPETKMKN